MTDTASEAGRRLGAKAVHSPIFWLALVALIAWWQFGPASEDEPPPAPQERVVAQVAQPQLSDRQRYDLGMVAPVRAKAIRQAADRRSLVIFMREIEDATAAAIRQGDAREFKIQAQYAMLAMTRMAQIPNAKGDRDIECVEAAGDLHSLLDDVARGFSPARIEQEYADNSKRWRKSMKSCERAVGLKPGSRQL